MDNVNHEKHEAILKFWFKDLAKQYLETAPAPPISEVSPRKPTKKLAGDLKLVDVSRKPTDRKRWAINVE